MSELEKLNSTIMGEANRILYDHGLLQLLGEYGNPVVTGSYVLELMTWRDLDIYIETDDMTETTFFRLGADITQRLKPSRMHYRNEFIAETPGLPLGLYWGIYLSGLGFPEEWKIDLWAIDSEQRIILQKVLDDLRIKIGEDLKPAILAIKNHFCRHPEYRRKFTSMDIYQAVIEENIKSVEDFAVWLEENRGIS
ncbi:MAG: hypothetical protein V3R96_08710 [Dehalococcoidales bacterium]